MKQGLIWLAKACAAAALLIAAFAADASAKDQGYYVTAGVEALDHSSTSGNIVGRFGYDWSANLATEVEGRFGVIDDSEGFKVDWGVAAYGVLIAPLNDTWDLFARAGYHYTETSSDFGDASGDDFAFGAGVQYNFGTYKLSAIRAGYTNLDAKLRAADVFSISYVFKF